VKVYKNDINEGTIVTESDFPVIFNNPPPSFKISQIKDLPGNYFNASKGKGKINLNLVMRSFRDRGAKIVMLQAAGEDGLEEVYKRYGFITILHKFVYYRNVSTNKIMIGANICAAKCSNTGLE
jgi:hypothetical protein